MWPKVCTRPPGFADSSAEHFLNSGDVVGSFGSRVGGVDRGDWVAWKMGAWAGRCDGTLVTVVGTRGSGFVRKKITLCFFAFGTGGSIMTCFLFRGCLLELS